MQGYENDEWLVDDGCVDTTPKNFDIVYSLFVYQKNILRSKLTINKKYLKKNRENLWKNSPTYGKNPFLQNPTFPKNLVLSKLFPNFHEKKTSSAKVRKITDFFLLCGNRIRHVNFFTYIFKNRYFRNRKNFLFSLETYFSHFFRIHFFLHKTQNGKIRKKTKK